MKNTPRASAPRSERRRAAKATGRFQGKYACSLRRWKALEKKSESGWPDAIDPFRTSPRKFFGVTLRFVPSGGGRYRGDHPSETMLRAGLCTALCVAHSSGMPTIADHEGTVAYQPELILWCYLDHNLQGPARQIVIWLIQRPGSIIVHFSVSTWGTHYTRTSQSLSARRTRCGGGSSQP